jgi:hypothetical protein
VHPDASRPVLRGQQVRQAAWRSDDLPFNKIVFVLRPIVLFVGSLVGQFAARIIGNLRDRALAFGPADRANGEMEDRHVSNRDFGLVGKKDRCPARGSEPLLPPAGRNGIAGDFPRCTSANSLHIGFESRRSPQRFQTQKHSGKRINKSSTGD